MEQENSSLRDGLLARLPQPENLAAYREETATLLARHEKVIFWDRILARMLLVIGGAVWFLVNSGWAKNIWGPNLGVNGIVGLESMAVLLFFFGMSYALIYHISRSKLDLLKEVKQLQLQLLEVQVSLRKDDDESR